MRKYFSYMFFGPLSKHVAGQRVLTDKERRNLIISIYSVTGLYLWHWWKNFKREIDWIEGEVTDTDPEIPYFVQRDQHLREQGILLGDADVDPRT